MSPIYKSGDHNSFSNYRPISVLNIFSKFFEKVINTRLVTFFNKHNIITDSQFGFRSGYSTYMPLVSLIDKITENLDRECPSIAIFIDFRKAFDTIDHHLLIKKLEHYGVRGIALNLIISYLNNRMQCVSYNNTTSDYLTVDTGVPQGSILGTLLFLIYINDIVNASTLLRILLFADDTTLLYSNKSYSDLFRITNIELSKLNTWFQVNKLSLIIDKTKYMIFEPKKILNKKNCKLVMQDYDQLNISIHDTQLERVNCTKFLGVTVDSELNWKQHIIN